jgi:hypothetical protein
MIPASCFRRLARAAWTPWVMILLILAATVAALRFEGRVWWCACGQPNLWAGDVQSSHSSQHLFDPYTFTHIFHGVLICGVLAAAVALRSRAGGDRASGLAWLNGAWALVTTVLLEALWELLENSPFVIQRYRTATIALGYEGDSIINSLSDILACSAGFLLARRIGLRWSIVLFAATELVLLFWIRDNLLLNIVMLVWPIEAVKAWQSGL